MKLLRFGLLLMLAAGCFSLVILWSERVKPLQVDHLFRIEMFAISFSAVFSTWSWIEVTTRVNRRAKRLFFLWTVALVLTSLWLFFQLLFRFAHDPTHHLLLICGIFAVFAVHNLSIIMTLPAKREEATNPEHIEDVIDAQQWLLTENLPSACAYLLLAGVIVSLQRVGITDAWFGVNPGTDSMIVFHALITGAAAFHLLISTGTFLAHLHWTYRPQAALSDYLTLARTSCEEWNKEHDKEWDHLKKRKHTILSVALAVIVLLGVAIILCVATNCLPVVLRSCGELLRSWLE